MEKLAEFGPPPTDAVSFEYVRLSPLFAQDDNVVEIETF